MDSKTIEKDTVIFQEGDVADVAYFIVSGKVETLQAGRGLAPTKKILAENEIVGELAVYDPTALRPYQAKALEQSTVIPIPAEALAAVTAAQPVAVQALLQLAFDKMKQGRAKTISRKNAALTSAIKKITIKPVGDKMNALFKPVEVSANRLPFRVGGFPEGGEPNRRDTVHLSIPAQANPLRVSRQHCEIGIEEDTLIMTDLGSRFCTTVNGTTIGRGRGCYSLPLQMGENSVTLGTPEGNYTLSVMCE